MCCSKAKRQIRNQERQLLLGTRTSTSTPSRIGSPPPYSQVDKQHTPFDLVTYNSGREKTSPTHSRQGSLAPLSPAFQAELCPPQIFGTDECLARGHEPKRKYGAVGIIAGIAFFPWGLFWTRCDSSVVCKRCKKTLEPKGHRKHKGDKFALDG